MSTRRRSATLIASLALAAAIIAAFNWQTMSRWFRPPPPPEKLTIAVIDTYIGSGLVLVAAAKGYFVAEGLAVTLQPHSAGRAALNAVLENKADVATVGNLPVVFATLNKARLSIVATIASTFRGGGIVARRDRGVAVPADLKGKTVGVTLGTDGHFILSIILAGHGLASSEVRTEGIKPEAIVAALSAGQVDAISTWEPLLSKAKTALGAAGVAIDLDRGFAFWFYLAGQREFVRTHPATMQKLLRALLRAERYVEEHPVAAAAIIAEATSMDRGLFDALWPNVSLRLALPQGLLTTLEDQARWAISNHFTGATEIPNFLEALYLDGLLTVRPETVSIIR